MKHVFLCRLCRERPCSQALGLCIECNVTPAAAATLRASSLACQAAVAAAERILRDARKEAA